MIVMEDTTFLDMVGARVRARAEARAAGDTDAGGATCEVCKTQSSQAHDKAHMLKQMLSTSVSGVLLRAHSSCWRFVCLGLRISLQ